MYLAPFPPDRNLRNLLPLLYYNMRHFCNLIGFEQWYFSLNRNTFTRKLPCESLAGSSIL